MMENPIKMDDFWVPLFSKTPIYRVIYRAFLGNNMGEYTIAMGNDTGS